MFQMVSESMLANVIVYKEDGAPLKVIRQSVRHDGGTVVGRDVIFQTPIQQGLSEEVTRLLIMTYSERTSVGET